MKIIIITIIRVRDPERLDYENQDAKNFKFNVVAVTPDGQEVRSAIEVISYIMTNLKTAFTLFCTNQRATFDL